MNKWLTNFRMKPEPVRRRLSFIYALAATSLVVVVWGINFSVELSSLGQPDTIADKGPTPAEMMLSMIDENIGRVKSGASQAGAVIKIIDSRLRDQEAK